MAHVCVECVGYMCVYVVCECVEHVVCVCVGGCGVDEEIYRIQRQTQMINKE